MTVVLTDKIAAAPVNYLVCECGGMAEWVTTTINGDRFYVAGYEEAGEEVIFDVYCCPCCEELIPDKSHPIWLDDESSFKVIEVQS